MIKVSITDDQPIIRQGLQTMLNAYSQLKVLEVYASGEELLAALRTTLPDVLLLDIQMPGQNGIEIAKYMSVHYPTVRIIALTNEDALVQVKKMLQYCKGYLLKNADGATLLNAIETVYQNKEFLQEGLKERLFSEMFSSNKKAGNIIISKREKEVLALIVDGLTTPEIAAKLFLSLRTVDSHRYNLMQKIDVKNVAELVKVALEAGLM